MLSEMAQITKDWEGYVKRVPMLKKGIEVLKILEKHGQAYITGGAVRDIITGEKTPDDIDIATNVPMEKIEELFKTHDIGANKDFGIVVVDYKGESFEVAQFRKDGTYSDGRRPDKIEVLASFKGDAERRDFTINAMAVDSKGNIIDYFDGQKDIKNKLIKAVGDPEKRFSEDYLRMLRAVRFSSRLGMDIDPDTISAIKNTAVKIKDISPERITKELLKMAKQEGTQLADAILMLDKADLLKHI
jgi:tRNA nucleotidyltransferase (CCA-adding enzyme)